MRERPRLVRFLVGVQHRPATSMLVANGLLLCLGAATCRGARDLPQIGYLAFTACAVTATAEVMSRARSLWSRVAVVGIGTGATLPLALATFKNFELEHRDWPLIFGLVAAATAAPHATVAIAARFGWLRSSVWQTFFAFGAAALFVAGIMTKDYESVGVRVGLFGGWLVVTQIAFHSAVAATARLWRVILDIVLVSGACIVTCHGLSDERIDQACFISLGIGWLLGVLFVPVARLGRSFTAVPLDHPIHTDFGGPKTR